jgi:outer membrane protein assembly factor BamB
MSRLVPLCAAALLFSCFSVNGAEPATGTNKSFDWPQWQGQDRSAVSKEKGLLSQWPEKGPTLAWSVKILGGGYSTPSIAAGRIFGMGARDNDEGVWALSEADGKELWWTRTAAKAKAGYDEGPRCTPTVDGELLYALGMSGDLVCLKVADGELVWKKNLPKDFNGRVGGWKYAESPLVDGDRLLVTPGGDKATIVCLDKKNGDTIWTSKVPAGGSNEAAYSSIVKADVGGQKEYIQFLSGNVVGIAAEDGKFLWRYKDGSGKDRFPGIVCSTPIYSDSQVYAAASYGKGGGAVQLTRDGGEVKATEVFFNNKYENHHGGLVLIDGYLYGEGSGNLVCIEFKTGKEMWREKKVGKGSIAAADGKLYYRNEGGPIYLVDVNPEKFVERGSFKQPDRSRQNAWPHPVIANGKLYIRDQDLLLCYDVKEKK